MKRLVLLAVLMLTAPAAAADLQFLDPGGRVDLQQDIPVTVVYVGLEPGAGATGIDATGVEAEQPRTSNPDVRVWEYYGNHRKLGLHYAYDYRSVFAPKAFEDAFFGYLSQAARGPFEPTIYQQIYSGQNGAAQQITSNYVIDGDDTERWLAQHAGPMLGVDTTKPTVFFINWFGRPDFRFHTYGIFRTQDGMQQPFGQTEQGQLQGWGGGTPDDPEKPLPWLSRTWFYDVSAGPEYNTVGWQLTSPDLTGDGITDDRLAPVWEYGSDQWFRPFDSLSDDLSKVLRYVAVDALFGPPPFFDPALSPPLLAEEVEVDINRFDLNRFNPDTTNSLRPAPMKRSLQALDPTRRFDVSLQDLPFKRGDEEAYECYRGANWPFGASQKPCFPELGSPTARYDLGNYFDGERGRFLDGRRYEVPVGQFDAPDHRWLGAFPYGVTTSRYPTGIQGWIWGWETPYIEAQGFGSTENLTHEVGHHLGLQHPHDFFDEETGIDTPPSGEFYFAWIGDDVASVMSYLPMSTRFSQFDRDSMARWQTAVRLQWANRILADVVASPKASKAAASIAAADALAGAAESKLQRFDLAGASSTAAAAYAKVLQAADQAKVKVEPWSGSADQGPTGLDAWFADPVLDDGISTRQAPRVPENPRQLVEPGTPRPLPGLPKSGAGLDSALDR